MLDLRVHRVSLRSTAAHHMLLLRVMRTALPLVVASLLVACAQSHVLPREDYCDRLMEAACRGVECCSDPARRDADVASCIEARLPACEAFIGGGAFEAGLVVYDEAAAALWVEAVASDAESCLVDGTHAPNPTYGTGGEGESCLARGDDTSWQAVCGPGLSCSFPGGVCVRPMPQPEASPCESSDECPGAFYCADDGICGPRLADGAACSEDRMCGTGHCVEGICGWPQESIDDAYCVR
jgi:hypothetical protein